jgi:hypothetical protein
MLQCRFFRIAKRAIQCLLAVLVLIQASPVFAHVEIQPIFFGRWVITANDANYFISLAPDGSYSNSSELIMLEPPQAGIYTFDGFTDGVQINDVTVSIAEPLDYGSSTFLMDDFQVIYPPTSTGGEITIEFGARARTSGDGNNYGDGLYTGVLTVEIHL